MGRKRPTPSGLTGHRLFKLIKKRRLSYEEFAAAAGVYPSTIYRMITGQTQNPQPRTKRAIARALGVSARRLFAGEQRELPLTRREQPIPVDDLKEILATELSEFLKRFPGSAVQAHQEVINRMYASLLGYGDGLAAQIYRKQQASFDDQQLSFDFGLALETIPFSASRLSVRDAVDSLVTLRLLRGEDPTTPGLYDAITILRRPAVELR